MRRKKKFNDFFFVKWRNTQQPPDPLKKKT